MLDLNELASGDIPAITPALGAMLAEAAGVCLESQGHSQGVRLSIDDDSGNGYTLVWPSISAQQADDAWTDDEYTTEHGAVGVAALLAKEEIGYEVIRRSAKGTGFDYWLGDITTRPFQDKARMEVSGIRQGDTHALNARVNEKLSQMSRSDNMNLPGYAVVVEFGQPIAKIAKRNERD